MCLFYGVRSHSDAPGNQSTADCTKLLSVVFAKIFLLYFVHALYRKKKLFL